MRGSEFHTFGPNDENALIPQVWRENVALPVRRNPLNAGLFVKHMVK